VQTIGSDQSNDVALGDLDGDGDLDAFVANQGPNTVFINQGGMQGGTAGEFSDSGMALGSAFSEDVSLGDLDGDGDLDAFVANGSFDPSRIWVNTGNGSFIGGESISGGGLPSSAVALGDLDSDGDLDAFIARPNVRNLIVWNKGGAQSGTEGTFTNQNESGNTFPSESSRGIELGDLDGDGDLDAFVANSGESNSVWINQGGSQSGTEGIFQSGSSLSGSALSYAVALGDLNGDGDLDAVLANFGDATLFINSANPAVLRDDLLPPTPVPHDDDHGNAIATATPIDRPTDGVGTRVTASGNYTRDIDAFTFEALPRQRYFDSATSGEVEIYLGNDRQRGNAIVDTANLSRRLTTLVHNPDTD